MRGLVFVSLAVSIAFGPGPAAAAEVAVLAFGQGLDPKAAASAWLPQRVADLTSDALRRVGHRVPSRRLLSPGKAKVRWLKAHGFDALATGRVLPAATNDPTAKLELKIRLTLAAGKRLDLELAGTADHLEVLAAKAAAGIAAAIGSPVGADLVQRLAVQHHSFLVHRFLGEAQRDLEAGRPRRARMKFDRAGALRKFGVVPEAITGSWRARSPIAADRIGDRVDTEGNLARAAREKAEVTIRRGETDDAVAALLSFVRYTPRRAKHLALDMTMVPQTARALPMGGTLLIQGASRLVRADPVWGAVIADGPVVQGLIGAVGGDLVVLKGRKLERRKTGRTQWAYTLPFAFELPGGRLDHFASLSPLAGEGRLIWVDLSLGSAVKTIPGVRMLAHGTDGAAVSTLDDKGAPTLALLRPGRASPAWKASLPPPPWNTAMVNGRVLVLGDAVLHIFDAPNGKRRGAPLPVGQGARWLGATGRYGIIATADGAIAIFDVLVGIRTATVRGPADAVAAIGTATGVAVAFSSGDLLSYDRDGVLLDRALVPGVPFAVYPGNALAPGPLVLSTAGAFAYGDVPENGTWRDVDAWLRLAEVLRDSGEPAAAMRVLDHLALDASGRVAQVEAMRAGLLAKSGDAAAAKSAAARAQAASDPTKALPRFVME